jgi:hypothetical protein
LRLSILVPFRDADGTRTRAKDWILARWQHFYPDAEFIVEPDDGVDPFNKSMAVNNAAAKATGDTYVILDADAWIGPEWMERAVAVANKGQWTRPARHIRLQQGISDRLLALPPHGDLPSFNNSQHFESHGPTVGFLWVLSAKAWWDMAWCNEQGIRRGMDERIRGWGGEDSAFTMAAKAIVGPHKKIGGTVLCLWHARPRQAGQRIWVNQDRTNQQELDKQHLVRRYQAAAHRASRMREVLQQP